MSKTAIVFGITGQDGSYLTELLLEKDYHVVGITRRVSTGNTGRISHLMDSPQLTLVEGDLTDYSSILRTIEEYRPEEVYNLAAMSHVGTSFDQPLLSFDVTGKGCLNILEVIRDHSPFTRFYQASSSEMFGDSIRGDGYQGEDTLFNPQSPYAIAKVAAHQASKLYRQSYGIHASCGILFNHESERRGGRFVTKKITKYIARLNKHLVLGRPIEEAPILTLGNLDAKRDWGHAEDYVKAMWLIVQQDEPDDYVVATGEAHSVRDFLETAFSKIGVENYMDFVTQDPKYMRPSEVPYLRGDYSKALARLSWKPEVSFDKLVDRMVKYDIMELGELKCQDSI